MTDQTQKLHPHPKDDSFWDLQRLSPGEGLALLTLIYLLLIAIFNAGYFREVPGRYAELFAFSDLLGSNITFLQYIVSSLFIFYMLYATASLLLEIGYVKETLRAIAYSQRASFFGLPFLLLFIGLLHLTIWRFHLDYPPQSFGPAVLPYMVVQCLVIYLVYVGYRDFGFYSKRFFLVLVIGNIVYQVYDAGKIWVRFDIKDDASVQSILSVSAGCLDRKILRAASGGYLLYSPQLKTFEFRDKSDIRLIYDKAVCH